MMSQYIPDRLETPQGFQGRSQGPLVPEIRNGNLRSVTGKVTDRLQSTSMKPKAHDEYLHALVLRGRWGLDHGVFLFVMQAGPSVPDTLRG
jgi:hypothetical protein